MHTMHKGGTYRSNPIKIHSQRPSSDQVTRVHVVNCYEFSTQVNKAVTTSKSLLDNELPAITSLQREPYVLEHEEPKVCARLSDCVLPGLP